MGGSPGRRSSRYAVSTSPPSRQAAESEIARVTPGRLASARIASIHCQQLTGSPWLMKYALPATCEPLANRSAANR